jgi:hypothetical protein
MFNLAQIRTKTPALVFVAAHEAARGIAHAAARIGRGLMAGRSNGTQRAAPPELAIK